MIPIANMIQSSGYQHTLFFFGILQGVCIFLIAIFMVKPVLRGASSVAVAAGGLMATAQIGPIAKDYGLAKLPMSLPGLNLAAVDDDPGRAADTFGAKNAAANDGTMYTATGMASLLIPLTSVISAGGNWDRVFIFSAAISIVAGLTAKLVLAPMRRRTIAEANARGTATAS